MVSWVIYEEKNKSINLSIDDEVQNVHFGFVSNVQQTLAFQKLESR